LLFLKGLKHLKVQVIDNQYFLRIITYSESLYTIEELP
jgi:hypothetical protein